MRDVDWSYGIFLLLALTLAVYFLRTLARGRARNPRVDQDGGSLLVTKGFMEFGYWLMEPVAAVLFRVGVTPDQVTAFSLLPALAAGVAAANGAFGLACCLSTLASLCDTLDGLVARRAGTASDAGEAFDALADRYVEFFFMGGLVIHYRDTLPLCVLALAALLGAFLISYSTAKAEAIGVPPPRGLMRRAERAIYLGVAAGLTPFASALAGAGWPLWLRELPMVAVTALIAVVANLSTMSRLRQIMRSVRVRDASHALLPSTVVLPAASLPPAAAVSRRGEAVAESLSLAEPKPRRSIV
jgi:phosphatidylglycerophosphate synthase